jgi:peptide/nickel transport system permease protein
LTSISATAAPVRHSLLWELWRDKPAFISLAFLALLVLAAIFAPIVAPYDPAAQSLSKRMLPPVFMGGSWAYPLGTDNLGRDLLSRLIYGARASLGVGVGVVAIAGTVGTLLGLVAGYLGGPIDRFIMRWVDAQLSVPDLLLALIVLAVVGPSFWAVIVVLSLGGWMIYARTVRGIVVSTRRETYVEAAEMIGARPRRVMVHHILPSLAAPLMVLATLEMASVILAEAALSFLGMGVQPPMTSWGLDISKGRDFIFNNPWLVTLPGLAITLTILSIYLVSNWLRQTNDPAARDKRYGIAIRGMQAPATLVAPPATKAAVDTLLDIDNLAVSFETRRGRIDAVRDVSLHIGRAETLGVVGESGSGKSVTTQAVMGLIDPPGRIEAGDIRWKGRSLIAAGRDAQSIRGKEIAIIFQDAMTSLNPLFTVGTQITEVIYRHTTLRGVEAHRRVIELMELVGISSAAQRLNYLPHQFSGGMRQRLMIAMALAAEPDLLIADEPTTALDVTIQAQIVDLLRDLRERLGLSVMLVTHDLGLVAETCDRVAVMYAGRIVEVAKTADLFAAPAHPYTAGLLRATPSLDDQSERWEAIDGAPPDPANLPSGCAFRPRCPRATAACAVDPALSEFAPQRRVACWHPATAGEVLAS